MLQGLQLFLALFLSHTPAFLPRHWSPEQTSIPPSPQRQSVCHQLRHHLPRQKVPVQGRSCTRRLCERTRSERPAVAEARELLSDWEADNVVETTGGAVVMTLTEQENRYLPLRASGWNDGGRNEYGDG